MSFVLEAYPFMAARLIFYNPFKLLISVFKVIKFILLPQTFKVFNLVKYFSYVKADFIFVYPTFK